jgi:hypothetical protein
MAATKRLMVLAGIILAAGLMTGCNLLSLPFFLLGPEPSIPAGMKELGSKEKRRETTTLVLTYAGPETRPEFIKVDRDLAARIADEMRSAFQHNEQYGKVVSTSKVEKFKQEHPNWQTMELADIGKHFGADFVVYVELDNDSLALFERGSGRELFRGHAEGRISLIDVHDPEDGTKQQPLNYTYPNDAKAVQASDSSVMLFKQEFLKNLARKVTWCFVSHPTRDGYAEE